MQQLQAGSCYAEVDISDHRIRDIKNGFGDSVVDGPRGIASGTVELKKRATGEREELSMESALARLSS